MSSDRGRETGLIPSLEMEIETVSESSVMDSSRAFTSKTLASLFAN